MTVGSGKYTYRVVEGWGRGADGRVPGGIVSAVATDSQDRVYVFVRKPQGGGTSPSAAAGGATRDAGRVELPAMLVYDRHGRFLSSWGETVFVNPHGLWISPDDHLYCADSGDHTIRKFATDGTLLQTFGTPGRPGAPNMPFNMPTKAMLDASGEMFVSDGYGQFRVHRFAADGTLLRSWGEKGEGPGQFALPHSLAVHRQGRVLVADRENNRIQIFDTDGAFVTQWTGLLMPMDIFIRKDDAIIVAEARQRISVFTLDGKLLARWGEAGAAPGQFSDSPHWLWEDSHGDLYISEVTGPNRLQKFARA